MDQPFEKLGTFYLGREHDIESGETRPEYLLYDAKDLTTHAVCVGMTGSGKTGLCLSLLEEAGLDGIPALVIDPKGDIGNLLLTFPQLRGEDFRPWIDESEATRRDLTGDEFAEQTATRWRDGLADWDQDGERIARFRSAIDMTIYTPGSSAGVPLTVLKSFTAPEPAVLNDIDAFRDRVGSTTAGLLALLGLDVDPVRSREFIYISSLLDHAWRAGRAVDLAGLIHDIQNPPLKKVGVMEVDTFYPQKDRLSLSMTLNSLLASPSFAGWLEGEPLDIKRLLYTPTGQPRISILSIAHLSDAERMFFVTILLNELLAWIRTQPGTPSLRAMFYMDEVFGYFPPVANPPSKKPMLTLLKQARAFGLGLVLATQNPVDLDYKGLSNCGTWFLGRLQTEQDKARVLDGLEGATAQQGTAFDRRQMDRILSGLDSRVFLLNNVHEDQPVVFQTRWVMSYLRGPLTRDQIKTLTAEREERTSEPQTPEDPSSPLAEAEDVIHSPPVDQTLASNQIPSEITQRYLAVRQQRPDNAQLVYRPALLGTGQLHFVRVTYHVDHTEPRSLLCLPENGFDRDVWNQAKTLTFSLPLEDQPLSNATFATVPEPLTVAKNLSQWQRRLIDALYRKHRLSVFHSARLREYSLVGENEDDFRIRLVHRLHEERDEKVAQLRERHASRLSSLEEKIRRAKDQVRRQESEYHHKTIDTALSIGSSIFGALFSRKKLSRTNIDRASSSARKAGKVAQERGDVQQAKDELDQLLQQRLEVDDDIAHDIAEIEREYDFSDLQIKKLTIPPLKKDITVEPLSIVWIPSFVEPSGRTS